MPRIIHNTWFGEGRRASFSPCGCVCEPKDRQLLIGNGQESDHGAEEAGHLARDPELRFSVYGRHPGPTGQQKMAEFGAQPGEGVRVQNVAQAIQIAQRGQARYRIVAKLRQLEFILRVSPAQSQL